MGFLSPVLFGALYESVENGVPEAKAPKMPKTGRREALKSRRPFGHTIEATKAALAKGPKTSGEIHDSIVSTGQTVNKSSVYGAIYAGLKKGLWKREPSGQYRLLNP
jgi:hypothetical protein